MDELNKLFEYSSGSKSPSSVDSIKDLQTFPRAAKNHNELENLQSLSMLVCHCS